MKKSDGLGQRLIVMGVSGCGKSTIGALLARSLGARFFDGDDFHPQANTDKMSRGRPLTDEDRAPWLDRVGRELGRGEGRVIGACSALKRIYRVRITAAAGGSVGFIHLSGAKPLIAERMAVREGHFMPTRLLDSQFEALEPPGPDEHAMTVDIAPRTKEVVASILSRM